MQQNVQLIITLASISLVYTFFYFYIYKQDKHKYIALWGFGWGIYSIGYLMDLFVLDNDHMSGYRNVLYILSSYFILLGTFEFVEHKLFKFLTSRVSTLASSLLVFLLLLVFYISGERFAFPLGLIASILLSSISVGTGIIFLVHEESSEPIDPSIEVQKRNLTIDLTAWILIIWGTQNGFYRFFTPEYSISSWYYISSIFLTNILNIALILVHSAKSNFDIVRSEKLYRLLAENSRDVIVKIQLQPIYNFVYVSPAMYQLSGHEEQDLYNDFYFFLKHIKADDRSAYLDYLRNTSEVDSKIMFRLIRKNREIIWVEQHSTLIFDDNGDPAYIEAILRDITDRMAVEEDLLRSENARRQLLANISHELRSPITSIIGYLSAINDNLLASTTESAKYIKTCLDKSITLNALIQDLFELSRLEAKQLPFQFEKTNAKEYFREVFQKYKIDIESENAVAELNLTLEPAVSDYISIDRMRMDQVFYNIVRNALNHLLDNGTVSFRYDPKGNISSQIVKRARNDYVVLAVVDNGVGIPKKDVPLVFKRFYRASDTRSNTGSGLGLTICKEIIELHGGHIWVESKEKAGTAIFIALPKHTE